MWGRNFFFFLIRMSDAAANLFYQQGCCPFLYPLFISFGRPTLFDMPPWVLQQRSCKLPSQSPGDPSSQMFLFLAASWIDPVWDSTSKSRICRLWDKTLFTLLPCQEGQVPTRVRFLFFFKCVEVCLSTDLHVSYLVNLPERMLEGSELN